MTHTNRALFLAWAGLVTLTVASSVIAHSGDASTIIKVVVLTAAVLKGHLILDMYMGARQFPSTWRAYFYVWLVGCAFMIGVLRIAA